MAVHGDILYFSCILVKLVFTRRGKVREVKLSSVIKNHLVKIYGRVEVACSSTHSYTLRYIVLNGQLRDPVAVLPDKTAPIPAGTQIQSGRFVQG